MEEKSAKGNIFQQIGQSFYLLNQPPNVYRRKVVHCFYEVISYTNDRSVTAAAMEFGASQISCSVEGKPRKLH
jgi:hypothetical protein